jgi:phage-related protein
MKKGLIIAGSIFVVLLMVSSVTAVPQTQNKASTKIIDGLDDPSPEGPILKLLRILVNILIKIFTILNNLIGPIVSLIYNIIGSISSIISSVSEVLQQIYDILERLFPSLFRNINY